MFIYNGKNQQLRLAINKANSNTLHQKLAHRIRQESFDMSTADSNYLAEYFIKYIVTNPIYVKTYYKRYSRALAYFSPQSPYDININTAKLNRTMGSIIGTYIHEAVHMFDHDDFQHTFGHGDNSPVGKQNTAPYKIGNIALSIIDETLDDFTNDENVNIQTAIHPWTRIKRFFRRWF